MPLIDLIPDDYYPTPQLLTRIRDEAVTRLTEWLSRFDQIDGPIATEGLVITQTRANAQQTLAAWDATIAGQAHINHGPGITALAGHLGADPDGDLLIFGPPPHPGQVGPGHPLDTLDGWSITFWNQYQTWLGTNLAPWGPFQAPAEEEK